MKKAGTSDFRSVTDNLKIPEEKFRFIL